MATRNARALRRPSGGTVRLRARGLGCALVALITATAPLVPAGPAQAASPNCPTVGDNSTWPYEQLGAKQAPADGNLGAFRAPIEVRKDGVVCKDSYVNLVASWIAIEDAGGINQIGLAHRWSPANNVDQYCKFWAIGIGTPQYYGCSLSEPSDIYFWVDTASISGSLHYDLRDCGSTAYTTCSSKSTQGVRSGTMVAYAVGESNYGDSHCIQQLMGSTGDKQNVGRASHLMEVRPDPSSPLNSWNVPTYDAYRAAFSVNRQTGAHGGSLNWCANYQWDLVSTNGILLLWDDRNGS